MPPYRHSHLRSTCVESTAGADVIVSTEKSIEKLDKYTNVEVEKCMKQPLKSVHFLKVFKIKHLFYYCFLIYPKINVSILER